MTHHRTEMFNHNRSVSHRGIVTAFMVVACAVIAAPGLTTSVFTFLVA